MGKTKTRRNEFLFCAGLALSLSACSTTPPPEDLGALVHTGFAEKADGSSFHKIMGLSCPANIDGMSRVHTQVYSDDGTDVSCTYSGDGRLFTLYLSEFPNDNLSQNFQAAKIAIDQRFIPQGYSHDKDLSQVCSSASLDEAAILSGFSGILSGENTSNEINLSVSPSAVYTQAENMTFVTVEEMFEKQFFKIRYTGPFSGENSVKENCELGRETYLSVQSGIRKERGIADTDGDKLLDLINASKEP